MRTDKDLIIKGLKHFAFTIVLMFTAPIVLHQAFKNTGHDFYIPVLIAGIILAIAAIAMGFYSVRLIVNAFFGTPEKQR